MLANACGKGTPASLQVQWNACYATGNLLNNDAAAALAAKRRQLQSLLSVLLALVRDSPNYKVSRCQLGLRMCMPAGHDSSMLLNLVLCLGDIVNVGVAVI